MATETPPVLLLREPECAQRVVELPPDRHRLTIGRRSGHDVALTSDQKVSRTHAVLECVGGDWTLVDDGISSNGSFVNGERVTGRRRLADGDILRLGETTITFVDPAPERSPTTRVVEELPTLTDLNSTQLAVLRALCRPFAGGGPFATPATNQAIAEEVFLSVDAVKAHLRTLFRKFDVDHLPQNQKRAQLASRAFACGVVSERDLL